MSLHLQVFIILITVSLICDGKTKAKDLEIKKTFVPDDCSEFAEFGDEVSVHYTGTLENGQEFDSSRKPGRDPLAFVLGQGKVILGWEEGIKGMCVGEKRSLVIPPHLGYGKQGHPPVIPSEATLNFETELVALRKPSVERNFIQMAQFLALPALVGYVIYYLYDKYKKESSQDTKQEKKSRKKRR